MPAWIRSYSLLLASLIKLVLGFMRRSARREATWWVVGAVAPVAIGILLSLYFWDMLAGTVESPSTTLRNLGLLIGGVAAMILAVWRSRVAERQADTAQRTLLNDRFERGAEMLGNRVLSVRLGGIYALERLNIEHAEDYHVQIMKLFCAFVRDPADDRTLDSTTGGTKPSADVQAILDVIAARGESDLNLEVLGNYRLDLRRGILNRAYLTNANFSHMRLSRACMIQAALRGANMSNSLLNQSDLTGANLGGSNLIGASLHRAVLKSAVFWGLAGGPVQFITYGKALRQEGLLKSNLSKARLVKSDMSGASLQGCDLSGADLTDANLSRANLSDAVLSNTILVRANLSGVSLSEKGDIPATGLTQNQLDQACANPENPPMLNGVADTETGRFLVWRGKPLCAT